MKFIAFRIFYFIAFCTASVTTVVLAPSLVTGVSLASLPKSQLLAIGLLTLSYLAAVLLLFIPMVRNKPFRGINNLFIVIAVYCLSFFFLYVDQNHEIAPLVITTVFISFICLWIFRRGTNTPLITLSGLVVITATLFWFSDFSDLADRATSTETVTINVRTVHYDLQVRAYHGRLSRSTKGGGLSKFGAKYMLATGDGRLYVLSTAIASESLEIERLTLRIPLNTARFREDVNLDIDAGHFRVTDIFVQQDNDGFRIFAAHHFWKPNEKCFVLRLSAIQGSFWELISDDYYQNWTTVFDTSPCLPLKDQGHAFAGHQAGGRIDMLDEKTIVMTVGDHEFDGNMSELILPQDDSTSYGKTLLINVDTGDTLIYSKGHRNPQGLHIDENQSIWLTEHGPLGGDELNLIVRDTNYGWPYETYGTAYRQSDWPLSKSQGRHREFEAPLFSWMPGIGISNLVEITSDHFSLWKSDLIVSSLKQKSLFRVRVFDGKVRYLEEIPIGRRIRDVIEGHDGQLILWTDDSALITVERAIKAEDGRNLFSACAGCHAIADGTSHGLGPDLFGVENRRPGSVDGFDFSDALININQPWNRESLDRFLANPSAFAPGTNMVSAPMTDATEREILIEYLLTNGQ